MTGILQAAGAAILWSTSGVLIKLATLDPFQLCFWRSTLALAVLWIFARPRSVAREPRLVLASFSYAASIFLFVLATRLTTAANAIFLTYTSPAFVLVLSHYLLRERISTRGAIAVLSSMAGMALFFLDSLERAGTRGNFGNVLAVGGGAAFALLTVLMRSRRDREPIAAIVLGNVWVSGIGAAALLLRGWGDSEPWVGFSLSPADAARVA